MNASRRKQLVEAISCVSQAKQIIEEVQSEEQDAFDNMPESLQSGEKGEAMSEGLDHLQEFIDALDELENGDVATMAGGA